MVDWKQAFVVAGVGFGGVFVVLVTLMLSMMAIGLITHKITSAAEKKPHD